MGIAEKIRNIKMLDLIKSKKFWIGAAIVLILIIAARNYLISDSESPALEKNGYPITGSPGGGNDAENEQVFDSTDEVQAQINSDIYVDVSGAVLRSCVVCLPQGSRVDDAINAAGGLNQDADVRYINRAKQLTDGEKVYIPNADEVSAQPAGVLPYTEPVTDGGALQQSGAGADGKVNINSADATALQTLSGIGPALSGRIIDYRESNGSFKAIEDIKKVSGIGDKTFEKFKDKITV